MSHRDKEGCWSLGHLTVTDGGFIKEARIIMRISPNRRAGTDCP